jgi:cyclopropane fatty-acyl-phospholipid synthase-like methyltransferase
LESAVEWRVPVWGPAVSRALTEAGKVLPPDSRVLEIGFNTGLMSCYMAAEFGWLITGYDLQERKRARAACHAKKLGLEDRVEFRVCQPSETIALQGPYDAVFVKSVLYHIADPDVYREWLDWMYRVLRPGGLVIAVENGAGSWLDRFFRRRVSRARWSECLLFDEWSATQFRQTFDEVRIWCFGRHSHFFTEIPFLFRAVDAVERRWLPATLNHCFVAAVLASKRSDSNVN